jgi:tetratricopeptide (TPR) repeat protein
MQADHARIQSKHGTGRGSRWRHVIAAARSGVVVSGLMLCVSSGHAQPARAPAAPYDSATAQALLLDGVRAFRAERYEDALVLFRRVEAEQQPADIGFYLGTALHKLGRHLEALGAFRAAHRAGLREPIADYYLAVSCYRLGMWTRARQGFAALFGPAAPDSPVLGPRLQQGAQRFLTTIEQSLTEVGPDGAPRLGAQQRYEAARLASESLLAAGNEDGALEWLDEAARVLAELPQRAELAQALRPLVTRLRRSPHGRLAVAELPMLTLLLGDN